jgi:hypothetical protein
MAMRRCGDAGLVPASEVKKKRGEEGWIAAGCGASESRTGGGAGTGASAPEEGLAAAMGLMRQSALLGFFRRVYSDATIFQWIFRWRFDPVRGRKEGERREGFWFELEGARRGRVRADGCSAARQAVWDATWRNRIVQCLVVHVAAKRVDPPFTFCVLLILLPELMCSVP